MKKTLFFAIAGLAALAVGLVSASPAPCSKCDPIPADTLTLSGANLLKNDMKVTVAVPASYRAEGDTAHYPTLYLLNGHGGHYRTWPSLLDIDKAATDYGMIIVCPSGMNSWYWDSPVDPSMQMESFFVEQLIPTIDSLYRTRPVREQRAITGLSMGGHGALWLAMRHPDLFANAGATSGGVNIIPFPNNWNMADRLGKYADNPDRWKEHTVVTLAETLEPGTLNIIFDCGTEDFFYNVNCQLDSILNSRKIHHTYITYPGAHNGAYWSKSIHPQIQYFHRMMNPAK